MANDSAAGAQVATTTATDTPQVGQQQTAATTTTAQTATPSGEELTIEQMRALVTKANNEAAARRIDEKEYAALKKEKAEREAANLTDQQRAAKELETERTTTAKYRSRVAVSELKLAAQAAGILDPDIVADSLTLRNAVEFDADGEPTNIAKLIEKHKADKPNLYADATATVVAKHASSGGATNAGRAAGNAGLNDTIIAAMTPQERLQNIDALRAYQALKYADEAKKTKTTVQ